MNTLVGTLGPTISLRSPLTVRLSMSSCNMQHGVLAPLLTTRLVETRSILLGMCGASSRPNVANRTLIGKRALIPLTRPTGKRFLILSAAFRGMTLSRALFRWIIVFLARIFRPIVTLLVAVTTLWRRKLKLVEASRLPSAMSPSRVLFSRAWILPRHLLTRRRSPSPVLRTFRLI